MRKLLALRKRTTCENNRVTEVSQQHSLSRPLKHNVLEIIITKYVYNLKRQMIEAAFKHLSR